MSGKTILAIACPLTQEAAAVKQLIEFVTGKPCEESPSTFALLAGNAQEASRAQPRTFQAGQVEMRGKGGPLQMDSIRPAGRWPGGLNGPVDPSELKVVA